jgi:hypothetical protein
MLDRDPNEGAPCIRFDRDKNRDLSVTVDH